MPNGRAIHVFIRTKDRSIYEKALSELESVLSIIKQTDIYLFPTMEFKHLGWPCRDEGRLQVRYSKDRGYKIRENHSLGQRCALVGAEISHQADLT
jgi:hypothetical protein